MKKTVLLAFSGGIDSCYAAKTLLSQGYSVTGIILNTSGDAEMLRNAGQKAEEIGIQLLTEDVREVFKNKVSGYFVSEYLSGRTPAPCTICNYAIKWKVLYEKSELLGINHIATGHYFNISEKDGYFYVTKGADPIKDQSYYLWMLPQEVLSKALTPMGSVIKEDIKKQLPKDSAKESMGVCFLNGRSYKDFILGHINNSSLNQTVPHSTLEGNITDTDGNIIGRHKGTAFYTIGQKKDLELPAGFAVTGINAHHNTLIAGEDRLLYKNTLIVTDCHLVNPNDVIHNPNITVKVRGLGRNPEGGCLIKYDGRRMEINLDNPAWAPAPGQPVVLYDGDKVLGGGFLSETY